MGVDGEVGVIPIIIMILSGHLKHRRVEELSCPIKSRPIFWSSLVARCWLGTKENLGSITEICVICESPGKEVATRS